MNTIKRTVAFLLVTLMCVGLFAACNTAPDATDNSTEKPTTQETEKPTDTTDSGTDPVEDETDPPADETDPPEDEIEIITIAEALELCGESGNITEDRYYLKGSILSIDNPQYGQMTIEDETGKISVYGTYSADGSINYSAMEDRPYKGDIVLLHCILQNFNGKKEVKNARLISFEKVEVEVDESDYTDMSVADARNAAEGTKIKVDGVVAAITYSNGQKPAGVIIVDGTQSIYVYDRDIAVRAKVGNTVTLLASKTYWILDDEKNNASKFGYKGCCQLEDVTLVSIDESVKDFDKSWITESTVKDILDTPVSENITTSIYKVNALVKKVDGAGFVNYYFYDLDGKTGAYTYTQCNGSDFAWLDEFDGKICTVYITALNAKSTSTDCYFRILPVAVIDEGYVFDAADAAEHAVKYYGIPQFNAVYTGNPAIEMITSVSSELLGFENAALSYSSSDTKVVYFEEKDGKLIFNCGEGGTATVTVKGNYDGVDFTATVEITVEGNKEVTSVTVAEAKDTAVGKTVTIKGIVGPSVVNKSAFYLFDGTGMIAVVVKDVSIFDEIEIGHEIVITGLRDCYKDAGKTHAGQTCITQAEVVANYYGNHAYPEDGFITDKTLADIYALNANEDHTTEVYVVKATVNIVETQFYTTISLTNGDTKLSLYCSGAGQYSFLKPFAGQEVTLEIAPCNWNNKTYYVGCVLAVITEDGKVLNTLNFNN